MGGSARRRTTTRFDRTSRACRPSNGASKRKSGPREIKALSGSERHPLRLVQRALADFREGRQRRSRAPPIQVPNVCRRHLRADLVRAVFRTPLQVLPTAELPALRGRRAIDLDDVHREVDCRGVAQARADAESVRARLEQSRNRLLVDPPGDEDLDVLVTSQVELPSDLADDRREIPPAGRRRIEPHAREVGDRLDRHERLRLLVVVRVHERDPRDLRLEILVDRRERLPRATHDDDEGVGHRAHRGRSEEFGAERRRDGVEAADVHAALDERRDPRVHASHPEREDLLAPRGLADPRRLRRDATRLADHPEDGRLVHRPVAVRPIEDHHGDRDAPRRLRRERAALRDRPDADRPVLQEMHDLLEAAEDAPRPSVRQAAGRHLGDDVRPVPSRLLQDVEGPHEVDVRRPARPDLVRRSDVEVTAGRGLGHRSRRGYFLPLLELLVEALTLAPKAARISAARTTSDRATRSSGTWIRSVSPGPNTTQRGLCGAKYAISVPYATPTTSVPARSRSCRTWSASGATAAAGTSWNRSRSTRSPDAANAPRRSASTSDFVVPGGWRQSRSATQVSATRLGFVPPRIAPKLTVMSRNGSLG